MHCNFGTEKDVFLFEKVTSDIQVCLTSIMMTVINKNNLRHETITITYNVNYKH